MDFLDFVLVLIVIAAIVALASKYLTMKDSQARLKIDIERKKALVAQQAARAKLGLSRIPEPQENGEDLGAWVPQLMETFGISPNVLFEDEMPEELKKLIPLAKGFLDSGGLAKLLGGAKQPAGPEMPGDPGWR